LFCIIPKFSALTNFASLWSSLGTETRTGLLQFSAFVCGKIRLVQYVFKFFSLFLEDPYHPQLNIPNNSFTTVWYSAAQHSTYVGMK